jgi:hypothetical protein
MVERSQDILTALRLGKEVDEPFLLGRNDEGTDECGFLFEINCHMIPSAVTSSRWPTARARGGSGRRPDHQSARFRAGGPAYAVPTGFATG